MSTLIKSKVVVATLIVVAVVVVIASLALKHARSSAALAVATAPAERGDVELLVAASGKLEPAAFVNVGAQVSGELKRLLKREGDRVQQGEVVAEIDDTLARARLLETRATLDNLRAQQEAQRAELTLARQRAERNRGLLERDAISRQDVEIAVSELDAAQARLKALGAQTRQAEASVATAETNLRFTTIRAPISGIIVTVYAREGQILNAVQIVPEVLQIANLDRMTVVAQVSEADVARLAVGQEAYFTVLGQPDRRREGKLRQIKPAPEIINSVVFYHALFDVPNDGALMPSMTAQVFFVIDRARDAVRVPVSALLNRQSDKAQVRVLKDGRIETRPVKLRLIGETEAAIAQGLEPGEVVVLDEPDSNSDRAARLRAS